MRQKNVAIIGSNGFLGKHLTERLVSIPEIKLSLFGKRPAVSSQYDSFYSPLDISDSADTQNKLSGVDFVYYLASETIPATSWDYPTTEIERNLLPFIKFLENIATLNIIKVIFISSAGTIYGTTENIVTEDSYKNPFSPYGITKLTMEYFLNYFNKKCGLNFDIYRVSNVFGEGQQTHKGIGIINTFLENIILHKRIEIFGDGNNVRNYVYVRDFSELVTLSLFADPGKSNIFNLSSNDTLTINELVLLIKRVVATDFDVVCTPTRKSDNSTIYIDNSKLLSAFPEFDFTPIEEGILRTFLHIKSTILKNDFL